MGDYNPTNLPPPLRSRLAIDLKSLATSPPPGVSCHPTSSDNLLNLSAVERNRQNLKARNHAVGRNEGHQLLVLSWRMRVISGKP